MAAEYFRIEAWAVFDTRLNELKSIRQINQRCWNKAESGIKRAEKTGQHLGGDGKMRLLREEKQSASQSDLDAMEYFQQQIARIRDLLQRVVDENASSLRSDCGESNRSTRSVNPTSAVGGISSNRSIPDSSRREFHQAITSARPSSAQSRGSSTRSSPSGTARSLGQRSRSTQSANVDTDELIASPTLDRLLKNLDVEDFSGLSRPKRR